MFAQVLANAIDKWWRELGRPDPFYFFEAGAGTGTLAAQLLETEMRCMPALRYVTVERSTALRGEQAGRIPIQSLETVLDPAPTTRGPLVGTSGDIPKGQYTGVIFANELLDNLSVDLYERRGRHWNRVLVGIRKEGGFEEILEPLDSDDDERELGYVRRLGHNAHNGARIPIQRHACDWLERAIDTLDTGRMVLIDYYRPTRWMMTHDFSDWMRTYRNQRPGTPPLEVPGTQDITCEVASDQLARVKPITRDRSQAEFLDDFGLADIVGDAREVWHSRAAIGDLGALKARAKVQEGRAITDSQGLGRYRVLEWTVGPE